MKGSIDRKTLASLLGGAGLTQLMIEHCVGLSQRAVKLPRIGSDYFAGE
jgi:restriction endonuclease Mrr